MPTQPKTMQKDDRERARHHPRARFRVPFRAGGSLPPAVGWWGHVAAKEFEKTPRAHLQPKPFGAA